MYANFPLQRPRRSEPGLTHDARDAEVGQLHLAFEGDEHVVRGDAYGNLTL